jgi:hypothetical protein
MIISLWGAFVLVGAFVWGLMSGVLLSCSRLYLYLASCTGDVNKQSLSDFVKPYNLCKKCGHISRICKCGHDFL